MLNHARKADLEAHQKGNHERSILFVINVPPQGFPAVPLHHVRILLQTSHYLVHASNIYPAM
jgi:hypothetical protein